jgi:hypothetical protein
VRQDFPGGLMAEGVFIRVRGSWVQDVAYILITVAFFVALAIVVRLVERL